MFLGFNELSFHGQFDRAEVERVLTEILRCRRVAQANEVKLLVLNSTLKQVVSADGTTLEAYVRGLKTGHPIKSALLSWLSKEGPCLDNERMRSDQVEFYVLPEGKPKLAELDDDEKLRVFWPDSTAAEAAHRCLALFDRSSAAPVALVSASPSSFSHHPLMVHCGDACAHDAFVAAIVNHTAQGPLASWLETQQPFRAWADLEARARSLCTAVTFCNEAFAPLRGKPFNASVAQSLLQLFTVLHELTLETRGDGRTARGQQLYDLYFRGGLPWFTDESDSNKHDFRSEMTFPTPRGPVFCPWHGKINNPPLRVHFTYPLEPGHELYIAYVGPKITKK